MRNPSTFMTFHRSIRVAVLPLVLWVATAAATSMLSQDVRALTEASDAVVHGKVKKMESRWTADNKRIVTDVWVEVTEALKGRPAKTVIVQQPGGQVGGIAQRVSGLASFSEGEEVILFLEQRGVDRFVVSGMAQGKFRVDRSSEKGPVAVPQHPGDAQLIDPQTRQPTHFEAKPIELDALRAQVRASTKAGPSPRHRKVP
jgi:hypothetical protein